MPSLFSVILTGKRSSLQLCSFSLSYPFPSNTHRRPASAPLRSLFLSAPAISLCFRMLPFPAPSKLSSLSSNLYAQATPRSFIKLSVTLSFFSLIFQPQTRSSQTHCSIHFFLPSFSSLQEDLSSLYLFHFLVQLVFFFLELSLTPKRLPLFSPQALLSA